MTEKMTENDALINDDEKFDIQLKQQQLAQMAVRVTHKHCKQ